MYVVIYIDIAQTQHSSIYNIGSLTLIVRLLISGGTGCPLFLEMEKAKRWIPGIYHTHWYGKYLAQLIVLNGGSDGINCTYKYWRQFFLSPSNVARFDAVFLVGVDDSPVEEMGIKIDNSGLVRVRQAMRQNPCPLSIGSNQ